MKKNNINVKSCQKNEILIRFWKSLELVYFNPNNHLETVNFQFLKKILFIKRILPSWLFDIILKYNILTNFTMYSVNYLSDVVKDKKEIENFILGSIQTTLSMIGYWPLLISVSENNSLCKKCQLMIIESQALKYKANSNIIKKKKKMSTNFL